MTGIKIKTKLDQQVSKKIIAALKSQEPSCGECVGYCTETVIDKKLCRDSGVLETQKPCNKFAPNTNELADLVEDGDTFMALAKLISAVPDNRLRLLGAVIMREKQTRANDYHIGQKIYVRYRGHLKVNYLSNFMSAFIMYADRDFIRVASRDGKCCMTFATSNRQAILSPAEFRPIREKMVSNGRYVDPDVQRATSKRLRCIEEYELGLTESNAGEIPTIDTVFRTNKVSKKSRKSSEPNDLVAIVRAVENGFKIEKDGNIKDYGGETSSSRRPAGKKRPRNKDGVVAVNVS